MSRRYGFAIRAAMFGYGLRHTPNIHILLRRYGFAIRVARQAMACAIRLTNDAFLERCSKNNVLLKNMRIAPNYDRRTKLFT